LRVIWTESEAATMNEAVFGPWRRSSYSGNEGNCVELAWRKSSRSGDEGYCVELAHTGTAGAIRDSKNPDGGHLEAPLTGLIAIAKAY
jgi:hypothetical protein